MGYGGKGRPKDVRAEFCWKVAETNLELLKWAREEKQCKWNEWTIDAAARHGNLEMVQYCVANECPINAMACSSAAKNAHLEILKYLREEAKAPWGWRIAYLAAKNGHLHILEYLVERKYDKYQNIFMSGCSQERPRRLFEVLARNRQAPWDEEAVLFAHKNNQTECLQYLLDNNCPLPSGWRYEDGTLHTS